MNDEIGKLAEALAQRLWILQKDVLTIDEVAQYTGMSKNYLYKLTMSRMIPHYKPNGKKCYFRRAEVDQWLTANPVATNEDLDDIAQRYCMTHRAI